jgi:membrane protease YdiL (CAAX protease family)
MSSTKTPKKLSSSGTLLLALLPWPAVAAGLFVFHSAFLAFLFYACVCLYGAKQLDGFSCALKPKWPLRIHLGVALVSNLLLVGLYQLLGKWLLPAELINERLAGVGITPASFVWLFPYFLIGNPLVEELFWRGGLRLRSFTPGQPLPSLYVAFLFGAWHSLPIFLIAPLWVAPLAVLGVMAIGFALGEVAELTQTLGDAILVHALAADLPLLVILWIASRS